MVDAVSSHPSSETLISNFKPPFVLTLDIGTSSLRAMLFEADARPIPGVEVQIKYEMRTTADGGVEADADEMFERANQAIDALLTSAGALAGQIAAVASDSMVSNVLGVGEDGRAVTPIYTYADTRSARAVVELRRRLNERAVHQRVGTLFHSSYLPARFLWLGREHPHLLERARWWMSLGEYLIFRWLGQRACTYSVASWTGMLNRFELAWDQELLALLPISIEQLSPLVDFDTPMRGLVPEFAARWPALGGSTWFPTIGDGVAANIGSGCVDATRIALTIGTTSALRVVVPLTQSPGPAVPPSPSLPRTGQDEGPAERTSAANPNVPWGLWAYRVDRNTELIGGALNEGGSLFAWMENTLRLDEGAKIESELAALRPDAHGLTILPFLAGERAPGWVADARAAILGLGLNTRPIEILRAGLESVAYRLDLVYRLLLEAAPNAREVIASGGALMRSPTWTRIVADVLGVPVIASAQAEATSRGTALLALKALDVIHSLSQVPAALGDTFPADPGRHEIYRAAVKRQQTWYNLLIQGKQEAQDAQVD